MAATDSVGGLMMTFAEKIGGGLIDLGKFGGQLAIMNALMPKGHDMSLSAPPLMPAVPPPAPAPAVPAHQLNQQAASALAGWSTGTMLAVGGIAAAAIAVVAVVIATR